MNERINLKECEEMNKRIISVLLAVALVFSILGVAAAAPFPGEKSHFRG